MQLIAQNSVAQFFDLEQTGQFNDNDFDDSAHLNIDGGIKLENHIVGLVKGLKK